MKLLKLTLLGLALVVFAAGQAHAISEVLTVNTSSLDGTGGYLYFQYDPVSAAGSTATVYNFATDGALGGTAPGAFGNSGQFVTGMLPGNVTFANTNFVNDYNQAITFGNTLSFDVFLNGPAAGGQAGGSSTFSLGLFQDALGANPLITGDGTLFAINLMNDGTVSSQTFGGQANVPEPSIAVLIGAGMVGLAGMRRRMNKLA
jgi:hypothetical protein